MGAFDGDKSTSNEDADLATRVRLLEQRRAGGMASGENSWDARGKKIDNLQDGSSAATKGQMDSSLALKTNKADRIVLSDHLDANYHSIVNIQTAGDNDAFSLFHGKRVFLTTNGSEFDAKNQSIKNLHTVESDDGSAVSMLTLKRFHPATVPSPHDVIHDIDLKHKFSVINAKQQPLDFWKTHYDNLMPFEDIQANFLSRVEEMPMKVQLNMNHNSITNLKDPVFGGEAATKAYVDVATFAVEQMAEKKLPLAGGKMTGQIDMGGVKIVNLADPTLDNDSVTKKFVDGKVDNLKSIMNKKAITATSHAKDEFRYLMRDADESSSEFGVSVEGIVDFPGSPHLFNKKAYFLKIDKRSSDNIFSGRIGFNCYKLLEGEFTICVEFFPAKMDGVSVRFSSTALNVNRQATKKFTKHSRSIRHMHKWHISPPEFLMVDLKWQGTADDKSPGDAHLIIYGIAGNQVDVPSSVFDAPFSFGNGELVMQTNLDLNGFKLLGLKPTPPSRPQGGQEPTPPAPKPTPHRQVILARLVKDKHSDCLIFANESEDDNDFWQFWGIDFKLVSVTLNKGENLTMNLAVKSDLVRRIRRVSTSNPPTFTFNENIGKDEVFFIEIVGNATQAKAAVLVEM